MASARRVLRSINDDGADRCVDVFLRPDGSFGFEEYRRDVEDGRGWFAIGGHEGKPFPTEQMAYDAALQAVAWLRAATGLA